MSAALTSTVSADRVAQAITAAEDLVNRPLTDYELEGIRRVQAALARHANGWHQLTFTGRVVDDRMVLGCEWCRHRTMAPLSAGIQLRGSTWVRAKSSRKAA